MPALPPKVSLFASFEPIEKSDLRYLTPGNSGNRQDLMGSQSDVVVHEGRADLPIGDGPHTLKLRLVDSHRSVALELPARQFLSTDGQAQIDVPAAQWQKALDMIRQQPK